MINVSYRNMLIRPLDLRVFPGEVTVLFGYSMFFVRQLSSVLSNFTEQIYPYSILKGYRKPGRTGVTVSVTDQ